MASFAWLRARPRALAAGSVVTTAVLAITTLAVFYQGEPTTEVDLHDGGVWVTKQASLMVGHFNHESQVLDGGLRTTGSDYDILQSGSTVLVVDATDSTVTSVDPGRVALTDATKLPADAAVTMGGGTVAVVDAGGALWVHPADSIASLQVEAVEPLLELGAGGVATVGVDGTVYAASAEDAKLYTVPLDAQGESGEPQSRSLDGLGDDAELSLTAVGTTGIALDSATGELYGSDGFRASVEGGDAAVLQQPSAATDAVALSTPSHLIRVPLSGGETTETSSDAQGSAAAPVYLKGCTYAAWSGSARFVRDCAGTDDDVEQDIEGVDAASRLQFRVNRDVVVLNDVVGGAAWMASDSMQRVDNWNDITPPEGEVEEDEQTTEESVTTTLPERSETNTVPIANDDDFGVRPGRTTVLPVLDNDTDADGDVLTASLPEGDPALGPVQPIHGGTGLQIAVPADASGVDSFVYQVDDGREGTDTARVSLSVHGWDVNAAPEQRRVSTITVESGGVVAYNVIPDWLDPDGDDTFLKNVVPAPGDEADFTSDGQITYRATSGVQGRKDIEIIVSDGTKDAVGLVRVDVRPVGSTVPITNSDHVVVRVGQVTTVSPLVNDTSSSREPLRLTRVDEVAGATITPDFANKTFAFVSNIPDTYYVQYLASAGADSVPGLVRVDVLSAADATLPPVAVRDVALLSSGGEALVNVLANDSDPAGGILVVQSVTVEDGAGISVAVLGHETLRISDRASLQGQVRIGYRISNGTLTADGEVIVIPVPAPAQLRPPVANDDTVVVRAGDVVTIPVLENDYHPNGDVIHVAPDLIPPLVDPADGEIFVSQDTLRFRAGSEPGTVYATYEAYDSAGQKDAGYVTIQVLPLNADTNAAPRPRDLTARTLSGSRVVITVPLDGIDADGDSVELVGLASAPTKGRIVETGADFLTYEAFDDASGVDTFTYRVRDRLGKEGTAPIRVGIAPPEAANQPPYAVKDSVVMRPGRSVAVPVLANDSDPEGDHPVLVAKGIVLPDGVNGLSAEVVGDRVVVHAPDEAMQTSLQYTIRDSLGQRATGVLQITVAADVPLQAPTARDDRVRSEQVEDGTTVDVAVLENDEDPDGTVQALTVTTSAPSARVQRGGTVQVTLTDTSQLITYTITDEDGLAASAFIHVPGTLDLRPTLLSTTGVEVKSGEPIEIPLADYVGVAGGGRVIVTEAAKVSAVHSDGGSLVKDAETLRYTSAAGYFGKDAITFEVTDGTGPDDPKGRVATLTLPITVLPPDNQQPTFVNGSIDVAAGEDAAVLDLRALSSDPDPGDIDKLQYQLTGSVPSGFSAKIDQGRLSVEASANTPKGTLATLGVRISDGESEPVEGTVAVRVTASTRVLATANDDIVPEADQGKSITIPVLRNDVNPFPETPLKIVAVSTETGDGVATVTGDGVQVTPASTFVGTLVIRYRVQDATGDADREVEGRIRLTVQGKPAAPGTPTVSSVQDRTVVLSWTSPTNNGAVITSYTVRSTAGGYTKSCAATTCTLDGLTNNVEYNFVVTATNKVGESDPSAPSQTARPDARPNTPNPPSLKFGDRSLQVAWVTPSTPGSPVESFDLEISPAPPSGAAQKAGVTGNSLTWEGLENGTNYQIRVRANNRAPEPSSWSGWSASEIPAGVPAQPAAPTTTRLDPVGQQAQLQVSWTPPSGNGDAISGYRLEVLRGGAVVNTLQPAAGQTSQAINVPPSTEDYTFRIAASNKAGWGATSAPSAPKRAFVAPGAPTGVSAAEGNNQVTVTYNAAPGNGANASELRYEFSVNGGAWRGDWDGRTITSGVGNNGTYTIKVRAYTQMDGVRYDGAESAPSNAVSPYGPVGQPGVSASASGTSINYSWSAPAKNGRDIVSMEIRIDGGGWQGVAGSGTTSGNYGHSETHTIEVRATDAAGQQSTNSASARTVDPPAARAWASKGGAGGCSGCNYVNLNTQNFPAGDYRIWCNSNDGGGRWSGYVHSVPANGTINVGCWYGFPGKTVWLEIEGWGNSEGAVW